MVHGFHRLRSFWSGPKGPKRPPGTHGFPDSPSYLLTSVFGVGVFDWTVTNIHVSAFLGCFECRRLKTSCFKAAPSPSLGDGCGFEHYCYAWGILHYHHFWGFGFCNTGLNRSYISDLRFYFFPFTIILDFFTWILKNDLVLCGLGYGFQQFPWIGRLFMVILWF